MNVIGKSTLAFVPSYISKAGENQFRFSLEYFSTINIAKVAYWVPEKNRNPNEMLSFSMSNTKAQ